jgi:hypothetical protein
MVSVNLAHRLRIEHENLRTTVCWMLSSLVEFSRFFVSYETVNKQTEDKQ